jgi:hypothetical protein
MVPPPPLPPPPLVGRKEDACSRNANSSPTTLVHAISRALKANASLDRPLPASLVGNKDVKGDGGNDNGHTTRGGQELD